MSLSDISSRLEERRRTASMRTSPITNAVRGVNSGASSAKSAVNGVVSSAGETFNQIGGLGKSFTGVSDSIGGVFGNTFGGSNDIAKNPVPQSGSGDSGASPSNRIGGFATDPTATLPSLDPLKREVTKPFEAANEQADGVMEYLNLNKAGEVLSSGWDSINSIVETAQNIAAPIQQRIEQSLDMVGAVASLPDRVMGQVSSIVSAASQVETGVRAVIDGVSHTFQSFQSLAHYTAINQFISDYASVDREQDTMDIDALRALIISMGQSMIAEGQQEKIEELINRIPDAAVRLEIYDELIVVAAELGYVGGVEYYQAKLGEGRGALIVEKVAAGLLANMTLTKDDTFKTVGARAIAVFNKMKPTWNISAATGRVELWLYSLCNANALSALITTKEHCAYAVAGGSVKQRTPTEMVDVFFPLKS